MARRFLYYLKLRTGELVHVEGLDADDAIRAAGLTADKVKRHMPVKALLTAEEIARRDERLAKLRAKKEQEENDDLSN